MSFTTPSFLVFLAIVLPVYWLLRGRARTGWLLLASLVFYGSWDWRFLPLLLGATSVDFIAGLAIARSQSAARRRAALAASLFVNLGTLAFFKYANFFIDNANHTFALLGGATRLSDLNVILPIGVSFYTFQALSYTIDVYRGRITAVSDPVRYFGFVTFFPQLVAGPINRAVQLLVQFERERHFDPAQAEAGCRQILWGFFKKIVVANSLAPFVSQAYDAPLASSGGALLWATYAFAFQIYCDFSGYTDIAIGCGRLFGFELATNFRYPYFATSIQDFWQRWHISLSTWFRDYVYIPLGGNRVSAARRRLNVFIVFLVSGFWHGANWTFLIWGGLHGLYFLLDEAVGRARRRDPAIESKPDRISLSNAWRMFVTFQLVCIAWVFFRAKSAGDAFLILGRCGDAVLHGQLGPIRPMLVALMSLLLVAEWLGRASPHPLARLASAPRLVRWTAYYTLVAAMFLFAPLEYVPFIYFQF